MKELNELEIGKAVDDNIVIASASSLNMNDFNCRYGYKYINYGGHMYYVYGYHCERNDGSGSGSGSGSGGYGYGYGSGSGSGSYMEYVNGFGYKESGYDNGYPDSYISYTPGTEHWDKFYDIEYTYGGYYSKYYHTRFLPIDPYDNTVWKTEEEINNFWCTVDVYKGNFIIKPKRTSLPHIFGSIVWPSNPGKHGMAQLKAVLKNAHINPGTKITLQEDYKSGILKGYKVLIEYGIYKGYIPYGQKFVYVSTYNLLRR